MFGTNQRSTAMSAEKRIPEVVKSQDLKITSDLPFKTIGGSNANLAA